MKHWILSAIACFCLASAAFADPPVVVSQRDFEAGVNNDGSMGSFGTWYEYDDGKEFKVEPAVSEDDEDLVLVTIDVPEISEYDIYVVSGAEEIWEYNTVTHLWHYVSTAWEGTLSEWSGPEASGGNCEDESSCPTEGSGAWCVVHGDCSKARVCGAGMFCLRWLFNCSYDWPNGPCGCETHGIDTSSCPGGSTPRAVLGHKWSGCHSPAYPESGQNSVRKCTFHVSVGNYQ